MGGDGTAVAEAFARCGRNYSQHEHGDYLEERVDGRLGGEPVCCQGPLCFGQGTLFVPSLFACS